MAVHTMAIAAKWDGLQKSFLALDPDKGPEKGKNIKRDFQG